MRDDSTADEREKIQKNIDSYEKRLASVQGRKIFLWTSIFPAIIFMFMIYGDNLILTYAMIHGGLNIYWILFFLLLLLALVGVPLFSGSWFWKRAQAKRLT